jgi:hypothetical protein
MLSLTKLKPKGGGRRRVGSGPPWQAQFRARIAISGPCLTVSPRHGALAPCLKPLPSHHSHCSAGRPWLSLHIGCFRRAQNVGQSTPPIWSPTQMGIGRLRYKTGSGKVGGPARLRMIRPAGVMAGADRAGGGAHDRRMVGGVRKWYLI